MSCRTHRLIIGLSILSNFTLSVCGLGLLSCGILLFVDSKYILLSRFVGASSEILLNHTHPFLYYIALGSAAAGLIILFTSLLGWWTICYRNCFVLCVYFLIILSLLLVEFSLCSMAIVWPQCIGLQLDETAQMLKVIQTSYGVPGNEELTDSIDLVQTHFNCCGIIDSSVDYDMSMWKLKSYGHREWIVPQSCCILANSGDSMAYLDPKPENITLCQSLLKHEYKRYRHTLPCIEPLQMFLHRIYHSILIAALVIAVLELLALISIILGCMFMRTSREQEQFQIKRHHKI